MTTRIKASLEQCIDKWIESECESLDWPDQYLPTTIQARMADAAYAVWLVSTESAKFTEEQGK